MDGGNIVGYYYGYDFGYHGFLYESGTYTTLDDPDSDAATYPLGISGSNVVGYYNDSGGNTHGFLYDGATYTTLDDPNGVGNTHVCGISGSNIVGYYLGNDGTHGFLYNGATYTTLDDPDGVGNTYACGVSGGNVVGYYVDGSGHNHGFIYDGTNYSTIDAPGAVAADGGTQALGISGSNVVGIYADANCTHGFFYNGSTYSTLGDPEAAFFVTYSGIGGNYIIDSANGTQALGVSGSDVVGYYEDGLSGNYQGFLYSGGTFATVSDPEGVNGPVATGISGNHIVGFYFDFENVTHGFLYDGTTYTTIDDPSVASASDFGGTVINGIDGGNMVGYYLDTAGTARGFLYDGSSFKDIVDPNASPGAGLNGGTYAFGISGNNIVGSYADHYHATHGFLYNGKTYTTLDHPGTLSHDFNGVIIHTFTWAYGISGSNIVGMYVQKGGAVHPFLYRAGVYTALNLPYASSYSSVNLGSVLDTVLGGNADNLTVAASDIVTGISGSNIVGFFGNQSFIAGGISPVNLNEGKYTLLISNTGTAPGIPNGTGYATMSVDAEGLRGHNGETA